MTKRSPSGENISEYNDVGANEGRPAKSLPKKNGSIQFVSAFEPARALTKTIEGTKIDRAETAASKEGIGFRRLSLQMIQ